MALDDIPTDVAPEYLSGAAAFVASGGERTEGMDKRDFAFLMNEALDMARVDDPDASGRASQSLVPKDEAGDEALAASDYTNNIFESELEAWAGIVAVEAAEGDGDDPA